MPTMQSLLTRANASCEFCSSKANLDVFEVGPQETGRDGAVLTCSTCRDQFSPDVKLDIHHWRCLSEAMWSEIDPVKVMSWRLLNRLAQDDAKARDQLEMMCLDDEQMAWASSGATDDSASNHKDCNGMKLNSGCSVTLIKDLNVKGAGFTAKRGTTVRNISLVLDNDKHIEGRVNGQQIVILTEFVKKAG